MLNPNPGVPADRRAANRGALPVRGAHVGGRDRLRGAPQFPGALLGAGGLREATRGGDG